MSDTYRVADFIADFIADMGVQHIFLLPGGGAMHLVDAVGKCDRLEVVACLHEQAASISAEDVITLSFEIKPSTRESPLSPKA